MWFILGAVAGYYLHKVFSWMDKEIVKKAESLFEED